MLNFGRSPKSRLIYIRFTATPLEPDVLPPRLPSHAHPPASKAIRKACDALTFA